MRKSANPSTESTHAKPSGTMTAPPCCPAPRSPHPHLHRPWGANRFATGANRWNVALVSALAAATLLALALLWRFEPQGQIFFPRCTFHQVTGLLCPGCGGLRATHALLHGELLAAWRLNPLLVASLPVAAWTALALAIERRTGLRLPTPLAIRRLWVVLLVLIVGFSIGRNL